MPSDGQPDGGTLGHGGALTLRRHGSLGRRRRSEAEARQPEVGNDNDAEDRPAKAESKSRWQKFLKWGGGVLALVASAILVAIATNGWNAVLHFFTGNEPVVGSSGTLIPAPAVQKNYHTRIDHVYDLSGTLSKSSLPRVSQLGRDAVTPPVTSWRLPVYLSGTTAQPVLITGMSVHIISRAPPRKLTTVHSCWDERCTPTRVLRGTNTADTLEMPTRLVSANLDAGSSNISVSPVGGAHFPFEVTRSAVEYFQLLVSAAKCACTWVVDVNWIQGAHSGEKQVENHGSPFHVSADQIVRTYCYDSGKPRGYANVRNHRAVRRLCEAHH
jgi:hypothetical protein